MNQEDISLHPNVVALVPMLEGAVKLLHPYAEGAIHDLRQGKVVALFNNISKRKVGDPSVVTELGVDVRNFPDVFEPYYKINWDGRKLKCTSVTIRDETGAPIGLVCLNFDMTVFEHMSTQLDSFLTLQDKTSLNPVEKFAVNWEQQVTDFIAEYAHKHNVARSALTKEQKAELVAHMYSHGLFNYRDAAAYVGRTLGVSRATVYNYLKEIK